MASKLFALCALLCAIQGLNGALIRPSVLPVQSLESNLYRDSMGQFQAMEAEYGDIIDKFENVVLNTEAEAPEAEFSGFFDDIMESVDNFDGNDMAEEGVDMDVVRKCIEEQAPNFKQFAQFMREQVAEARQQLRQLIVDTFMPYIQKAREAFRRLGDEIAQFPMKMWECIKEHNIQKAIELIRNTRKVVHEQANEIARNIREARSKFPMIRQKAMEMREKLRQQARERMDAIRSAIRQCIANGGPKVPLVAVPVEHVPTMVAPGEQVSTLIAPVDATYEA